MDTASIARLLLRVAHAIAAVVWLGGGAYYVLALRPALRQADDEGRAVARLAQKEFGEWASIATLLLIVTGVMLMYDRLTDGRGTVAYVALLSIKVVASVGAFWLAGSFGRRRRRRLASSRRTSRNTFIDRSWLILMLGAFAFLIGVVLASMYPTGIGKQ